MKKSFYNIEKNKEDELLIYNSYSGSVLSLEKENMKFYINEEFDKIKELNTLIELGIIIDDDSNEMDELLKIKDNYYNHNSELVVTILPTTLCNLRCGYCFESIRNETMTDDIILSMIAFIKQRLVSKKYKKLTVVWFGGEPLFYPKLVKKIYGLILNLIKELDIKLSNSIITNGTFLTSDNIELLKNMENLTKVQITIDGCKGVHDIRRPLLNGSSYDIIIRNLEQCVCELPISVRVNVDKENVAEVENLIEELSTYNYFRECLSIYFGMVVGSSFSYTCKEFAYIQSHLYKLLKKYGFKNSLNKYLPLIKPIQCVALYKHHLVFDANGDIYTCWEVVGKKEYRIGTLNDGFFDTEWKLKETEKEECFKCKVYPICHTGCPLHYKDPLRDNCMYVPDLMISDIEEFIIND